MRASKPISLFLLVILILCNTTVCMASGFTFNMDYNVDNCSVNIAGTSGDESVTSVFFTIAPKDEVPTSTLVNSGGAVVRAVYTDKNGNYSASIVMPQSFKSGMYTVYANSEFGNGQKDFSYINLLQTENSLKLVNSAAAVSTFTDALRNGLADFGIPQEEFTPYQPFLSEVVFSLRPDGGYTVSSLCDSYYSTVAAYKIVNGSDTFDNVINTYSSNTGIDYQTEHLANDVTVREYLFELMKKADYKSGLFKDIYSNNLFLAKVNTSKRYIDMSAVIADDGTSVAGIDLLAYMMLGNSAKEEVMKKVFTGIPYANTNSLKHSFDLAIKSLQSSSGAGQNRPSSGGGGGSYSVVGPMPEPQVKPVVVPGATSGVTPDSDTQAIFNDMSGHWSYADVRILAEKGIINGFEDGSFRPEEKVTRAEFVKMIVSAFNVENSGDSAVFGDVQKDMWYFNYIDAAASAGLVGGFGGNFEPDKEITREDVAVILYRLLNKMGKAPFGTFWFDDEETISAYSTDAVMALSGAGIIKGYNNKFAPKDSTKRCEAATLIVRLQKYVEGEEI